MKIRTGDRFKRELLDMWIVVEITTKGPMFTECSDNIKSAWYSPVEDVFNVIHRPNPIGFSATSIIVNKFTTWEYLGNYSKQDSFEELYDLLNEENNDC